MPTQGLPEHHSTCKGLSSTKNNRTRTHSQTPCGASVLLNLAPHWAHQSTKPPKAQQPLPPVLGHSVWDRDSTTPREPRSSQDSSLP